jgi:hypothetical protein
MVLLLFDHLAYLIGKIIYVSSIFKTQSSFNKGKFRREFCFGVHRLHGTKSVITKSVPEIAKCHYKISALDPRYISISNLY